MDLSKRLLTEQPLDFSIRRREDASDSSQNSSRLDLLIMRLTNGNNNGGQSSSSSSPASHATTPATTPTTTTSSNTQAGSGSGKQKGRNSATGSIKDDAYWDRRKKNNESAKRSRDARRAKETETAIKCAYLEQENFKLRLELATLKAENAEMRCLLYSQKQ